VKILMALETPDKVWRVEVVQRGVEVRYQMLRDGEIFQERATIGTIEHLLGREGISMADLVEVPLTSAATT
jgi:hypothetical protein